MAEEKHIRFRANIKPKGRAVSAEARKAVAQMLGDASLAKENLIENLHRIQDAAGCLSADNLAALAAKMRMPMAAVYEVASFYHHFDIVNDGDNAPPPITVRVCQSLSCQMAGGQNLLQQLQKHNGGDIRIIGAPCVGRCAGAPVAVVGQNAMENVDVDAVMKAAAARQLSPSLPDAEGFDDYVQGGGYDVYRRLLGGKLTAAMRHSLMQMASFRLAAACMRCRFSGRQNYRARTTLRQQSTD